MKVICIFPYSDFEPYKIYDAFIHTKKRYVILKIRNGEHWMPINSFNKNFELLHERRKRIIESL